MAEQAVSEATELTKPNPTKKRRRNFVLMAGLIVLLTLAGVTYLMLKPQKNPFTTAQTKAMRQLPFKVYYPAELPDGYSLNLQLLSISDQVVSYAIDSDQNTTVYFSFQRLPDRSTIDNLFGGNAERTTIGTPLGQATTAFVSNRQIASIVLDRTWLIISTVDPIEKSTLLALLEHMRQL